MTNAQNCKFALSITGLQIVVAAEGKSF